MPSIAPARLHQIGSAIFTASGSSARETEIIVTHLVEANLKGHDSHGIGMLPRYIDDKHKGLFTTNGKLRTVTDTGAVVVVESDQASGQVMAHEATELLIARAKKHGVALVALRNTHHMGRIGTYGEMCASAGLSSLHFVNVTGHHPIVAPFGGADGRFATNPICITVPASENRPALILDFATSKVALGKVRVAFNKGEALPEGLVIGADGKPTNDPGAMYREPIGALTPMGEHKGSGLALIAELFAGAYCGGGTMQPGNARDRSVVNNMLSIAFDPTLLGDANWIKREVDAMVAYAKASPKLGKDDVMVAGEPELRMKDKRNREGIPVDDTTWEQILKAGESVGLGRGQLQSMAR